MVARRGRILAIWFVSMLVLSVMPGFVPTAAADHATSSIHIETQLTRVWVGTTLATQASPTLKIGDTFSLQVRTVLWDEPADVAGQTVYKCSGTPSFTIKANLERISADYTATHAITGSAPTFTNLANKTRLWTTEANVTLTVKEVATGKTPLNNEAFAIPVDAVGSCSSGTLTHKHVTAAAIRVDNKRPSISAEVVRTSQSGTGIGTSVELRLTSPVDVASGQIDWSQFSSANGGGKAVTGAEVVALTLGDTNVNRPKATITIEDAAGNTATVVAANSHAFDASRPGVATSPTALANVSSEVVRLEFVPPTALDGETITYDVYISPTFPAVASSPALPIRCPSTQCVADQVASPRVAYHLQGLTPYTDYNVNVVARDDADNTGSPTANFTVTTTSDPQGTMIVERIGPGGYGNQARFTPSSSTNTNVSAISIDVSQLSASTPTLAWSQAEVDARTPKVITLDQGGNQLPTYSGTLFGPPSNSRSTTLTFTDPTGLPAPSFDTKQPGAVTGVEVFARADNRVLLRFVPPSSDVAAFNVSIREGATQLPNATRTFAQANCASGTCEFELAASELGTSGARHFFNVSAVDGHGNNAVPAPGDGSVSVVIEPAPLTVTIDPLPATRTWPGLTGTATAGVSGTWVNVTIRNMTDPAQPYWNGGDPSLATSYQATPFEFSAVLTGTTWTCCDATVEAQAKWLRNSTYQISAFHTEPGVATPATDVRTLVIDNRSALIDPTTRINVTAPVIQQGVTTLQMRLNVTDALSGIDRVDYVLVRAGDLVPAPGIGVANSSATCRQSNATSTNCVLEGPWTGTTTYNATTLVSFRNVPVGEYRVNLSVWDNAGNRALTTLPQTVRVAPRIVISQAESTPRALDGKLHVSAYAAYEALQSYDPPASCSVAQPCRVTKVEYYGRSGTTGEGTLLGTVSVPAPGYETPVPGGPVYHNYTPHAALDVSTLNTANAYVRARAIVQLTATTSSVMTTDWVRIRTADAPAGLLVTRPAADDLTFFNNVFYVGNELRGFSVNTTFEQAALQGEPTLNYTIRGADGLYYRIDQSASPTSTVPVVTIGKSGQAGDRYYFNWTNASNLALPSGDYWLNATVTAEGMTPKEATRRFSIAASSPTVTVSSAQPELYNGRYVSKTFNVSFDILHGHSRVNLSTTHPGLQLRLINVTGQYLTSGFTATLKDVHQVSRTQMKVNYTVTLPTWARDGERFDLRLNVSTETYTTCRCAAANGTALGTVVLDIAPATAATYVDQTRDTGQDRLSALKVHGFATDNGAGVQEVRVRVFNVSSNSTYDPSLNRFVVGEKDLWMSTSLVPHGNGLEVRHVNLSTSNRVASTPDVRTWVLNASVRPVMDQWGDVRGNLPAMPLDRASTYRIDVLAVDTIGLVSAVNTTTLTFDPQPPSLYANTLFGPSPPYASWHGGGSFRVTAKDNYCVARVSLVGVSPSNATVGPADFTVPAGAQCFLGTSNEQYVWTLDLAQHPNMTDEVGVYEFSVEAADPSGQVTRLSKTINVTVNDTQPAVVRNLSFEPAVVGAGTTARILADVFENHVLSRVEVEIVSNATGAVLATGVMTKDPARSSDANDTGLYVAETGADLNLPLEVGTYVVRVRAIDANAGVTCPAGCAWVSAKLEVVAEAPPAILRDVPAAGTTHVNATPVLRWRVLDRSIVESGIVVTAGPSEDALEKVTVSYEEILGVNQSVAGYIVTYTPTGLDDNTTLVVHLSATSSRTGFETNETVSYTVDARPPVADHALAGAVVVGNVTYGVAGTRVTLNASDDGPSVFLAYAVNGGNRQTYVGPIAVSGADGRWSLEYVATDRVGNTFVGNLTLQVDRTGPAISVAKHGDEVVFTVNDTAGVDEGNVTVHYAYGDAAVFTIVTAEKVTANSFRALLPGDANATGLRYWIQAKDVLGNTGAFRSAANPYTISVDAPPADLAPTVRIVAPADGFETSTAFELRWLAEDPEDGPLTISIAVRDPAPGRVLVAAGENTGRHAIDVAGFAPGTYTLVVTASDGENSASATTTFKVVAAAARVVEPATSMPSEVAVETPLNLSVKINSEKPIAAVSYRVTVDGAPAGAGTLRQSAGNWVAALTPTAPGAYKVFVGVTYADGTTEPESEVASFAVEGGAEPAPAVPASLMTTFVLAAAVMALAGYGAFMRWKQ